MSKAQEPRPLKMCCTCSYWSTRYKGFCLRLQTGVGRFWRCVDWEAQPPEGEESGDRQSSGLQAHSR